MKGIYFLCEALGLIFGIIGYILLDLKSESKLLLGIAITLVAIGLILIFGTIVLEKYMWWTSLGW